MNCYFCKTKLPFDYCKECKTISKDHAVSLFITLKDKQYQINIFPQEERTIIVYYKPYEGYTGGGEPDIAIILLDTNILLNINPSNAIIKLKSYLPFL